MDAATLISWLSLSSGQLSRSARLKGRTTLHLRPFGPAGRGALRPMDALGGTEPAAMASFIDVTASGKANYDRIQRLLLYAAACLRGAVRRAWESSTGTAWSDGPALGASLERRLAAAGGPRLFKEQIELVRAGKLAQFDLTLLFRAMSAVAPPVPTLEPIRVARNRWAHATDGLLSDDEFEEIMTNVSASLVEAFQGDRATLDRIRAAPLDEDPTQLLANDTVATQRARDLKEDGNRCYRADDYAGACERYTAGIQLGAGIPPLLLAELYTNRAAARLKLTDATASLADAEEAARLRPRWFRAQERIADALTALGKHRDAALALERALVHLPPGEMEARGASVTNALYAAQVKASAAARSESTNTLFAPGAATRGLYGAAMEARAGVGRPTATPAFTASLLESMNRMERLPPWLAGMKHVAAGHQAGANGRIDDAVREYAVAANDYQNAEGMYNLAVHLADGRGVAADVKMAAYWAKRATEQPIPEGDIPGIPLRARAQGTGAAWNMLGNFYKNGLAGYPTDPTKALECYEKSASYDWCGGLDNVGHFYQYGLGGLKADWNVARDLFVQSAEFGDNVAMFNMGILSRDSGDLSDACHWLGAAMRHGALYALSELEHCREMISSSQSASESGSTLDDSGVSASAFRTLVDDLRPRLQELRSAALAAPTSPFSVEKKAKPTADELRALPVRTPYVERLTDARGRLESAAAMAFTHTGLARADEVMVGNAIAIAAIACRIPDVELVAEHGMVAPIIVAAEFGWREAPSADLAVILSTFPPTPTSAGAIACHRDLADKFPKEPCIAAHLASLLMFNGPEQNFGEAVRLLLDAVARAPADDSNPVKLDLLYVAGSSLAISDDHSAEHFQQLAADLLNRFVRVAAADGHRKLGAAYLRLASMELVTARRSQSLAAGKTVEGDDRTMDSIRALYDLGMAAKQALPAFLQAGAIGGQMEVAIRTLVEVGQKRRTEPPPVSTPTPTLARFGGHALPVAGLAPNPLSVHHLRAGVTWRLARLRKNDADAHMHAADARRNNIARIPHAQATPPRQSTWSGSDNEDHRLLSIFLSELLAPRCDQVFDGRALTLMVVSVPVRMLSIMMVAEDARRDCVRLAVYNVAPADLRRWLPGRIVRIRNPYCRLLADDTTAVRIDHPTAAVLDDNVAPVCWYCLALVAGTALMVCSRCKMARYCSTQCQALDWKENAHKAVCPTL